MAEFINMGPAGVSQCRIWRGSVGGWSVGRCRPYRAVEGEAGFRGRIGRDNWVQQAEILARGGVEEYRKVFGKDPK